MKPDTASTSATAGATPTAFGTQACTSLDIVNDSSVTIEYLRTGETVYIPIQAGSARVVEGITNANQIRIRRKDLVATAVAGLSIRQQLRPVRQMCDSFVKP